jgi:putative protease
MKGEYELLAPVGSFRNLRAAIEAEADAVYFGVSGFNMRETAKNFSVRDFVKIRKICSRLDSGHQTGRRVKMYLTLNIVVYDSELRRVESIIKKAKGKVDAVICWDMAVINLCRKHGIPFHVSTQASVSNVEGVKFYKKLGAERIVLARELSLKQIEKIAKKFPGMIECFCHGAMCVAVSGRCFMSQHLTGFSANRGKCLQFCRRAWDIKDDSGNELKLENSRVMSAKDLCTLPFVERMKKAGIYSFKIEGRNRSPEYVKAVVGEYRKALDKKLGHGEIVEGISNLKKIYHRGMSAGFYLKMPTADDFSFSEHGDQSESKEFVGRVYKYWPKAGACSLKMNAGKLRVGDEVYLMSDDSGVKRARVESIELDGKNAKLTKKGDDVGIRFGVEARSGVEVYLIKKS